MKDDGNAVVKGIPHQIYRDDGEGSAVVPATVFMVKIVGGRDWE